MRRWLIRPTFMAVTLALMIGTARADIDLDKIVAPSTGSDAPSLSGIVTDRSTGQPLTEARVVVASEEVLTLDATLPGDAAVAFSDDQGRFRVARLPTLHDAYVEVFAPEFAPLHLHVTLPDQAASLETLSMSRPTPDESAWLTALNADRALWGAPPLVPDEIALEAARRRAAEMGDTGDFSHDDAPSWAGENIGATGDGGWQDVESRMIGEAKRCAPVTPAECAFNEATGHFLNIVNASYRFVGLGIAHHGRSFSADFASDVDYYAMEFE